MQAIAERSGTVLVALTEPTDAVFDQTLGVVVNPRRGTVSEPAFVQSLLARGYWMPFAGEQEPILALVSAAEVERVQAAGFDESKVRRYPAGTPVRGREGGGRFAPKGTGTYRAEGSTELSAEEEPPNPGEYTFAQRPSWLGSAAKDDPGRYNKATRPREAVAMARGWLAESGVTEHQGIPLELLNATGVVSAMEEHYPDGYEFFLSLNDLHKEAFHKNYLRGSDYEPARADLHNAIRASYLSEARLPEGKPEALFLAGGTGAGKSSIVGRQEQGIFEGGALEGVPEYAVYVNPDDIKEILPEAELLKDEDDWRWAALSHEESSGIANRLREDAVDSGFSMVVDGTGNAEPGKFLGKIRRAQAEGYRAKVVFVDIPTEEAIRRADERALKTKRKVSHEQIRDIHRNVTARHLEWREEVANWEVWANDDPDQGGRRVIARRVNGGPIEILDQPRYAQMEAKAR